MTLSSLLSRTLREWEALALLTHERQHELGRPISTCAAWPCREVNGLRRAIPEALDYFAPTDSCVRCREESR